MQSGNMSKCPLVIAATTGSRQSPSRTAHRTAARRCHAPAGQFAADAPDRRTRHWNVTLSPLHPARPEEVIHPIQRPVDLGVGRVVPRRAIVVTVELPPQFA